MFQKTLLAKDVRVCLNTKSMRRGLMFTFKQKCLLFVHEEERRTTLHMFFVFYPIDIIYLDKTKTIVELKRNLRPFGFYRPRNKAQYIIELPKNSIKETLATIGDYIEIPHVGKDGDIIDLNIIQEREDIK